MNVPKRTIVLAGFGAAVCVSIGYSLLWYGSARAELDESAASYIEALTAREETLSARTQVRERLQALAATTLGPDEETVSAQIRLALNQILAHHGLEKSSVATRSATPLRNPAALARVEELRRRDLRDQPDGLTLSATIAGEGTLEETLRAVATIQGQPWAHRIDSWSLRPEGKGRERAVLSLTLTTLILPGITPRRESDDAPLWTPVGDVEPDLWRIIAARDLFREPPPPPPREQPAVAAAPQAPPPPPPPGPPPLAEWRITGIAQTGSGPELMVVNTRTGESMVLLAGGSLLQLTFVRAAGESALVRIDDSDFEVQLGATLADRKPVGP